MAVTFSPSSPLDVMTNTLQVTASFTYTLPSAAAKATISGSSSQSIPTVFDCTSQGSTTYKVTGGTSRTFTRTFTLTPTAYGYQQGYGSITLGVQIKVYNANGTQIRSTGSDGEFQVLSITKVPPILGIVGAERCDSVGKTSDNGVYARIGLNLSYSNPISSASVKVDGVTTTSNWYQNYIAGAGCSTPINNWASISSGSTVYCIVPASINSSHSIEVRLTDSDGLYSTAQTNVQKGNVYPINFVAGGNGVGFGIKAEQDRFKCSLDSVFSGALKQVQVVGGASTEVPVSLEGHTHLNNICRIGSVITVGCTTLGQPAYNPSNVLGGNWTKIEEYLSGLNVIESDLQTTSSYWTRNTTNCTSAKMYFLRQDYNLSFTIIFQNKVAINDDKLEFLTLNLSNLGVNSLPFPSYGFCGWTDGGGSIVMLQLSNDGILSSVDYVKKASGTGNTHNHTTIPAGENIYCTFNISLDYEHVKTAACDRFLYRRIS